MMNLISDLTVRDFGGYHAVLAVHAEGSIEAEKMQIFRAYDPRAHDGLRPQARRPLTSCSSAALGGRRSADAADRLHDGDPRRPCHTHLRHWVA